MEESQLLRFLTAGSVDDGKSTLIGRLLYDTQSIYHDHFSGLCRTASASGNENIDFSLVTDGLRAEREQGITIDVGYRSFSTAKRRFLIADAPGHEQYTRNMATAASTASVAVLLIDASKGALQQTHRHATIAWLLGIRRFAVSVNKMDLVGFAEEPFRKIERDFSGFATKLDGAETYFIPTCSTAGDNIVKRSARIPWFQGMTLLEYLENAPVSPIPHSARLRLPVQFVIRGEGQPRRYAGQISSGLIRNGDSITVLPSGRTTRVQSIRIGDSELDVATSPQSVAISLEHDLDIGRGDMIIGGDAPEVSRRFKAMLLWTGDGSLAVGRPYLLKHTTRQVCAIVTRVNAVLNPTTLECERSVKLEVNEFGEVEIETHQSLYYDPYGANCKTGAFVLIDPLGNGTVGAGMITSSAQSAQVPSQISGRGLTVWFTGLSSAGKSTISKIVYEKLWAIGHKVEWLDGDIMRQHLNRGLSFTKADRDENVRRIGFVAELLTRNGVIALVSLISPYRSVRGEIRQQIANFIEVYVNAPLAVCEERDLKGVYRRARTGEIHGVTGIDDPYEPPIAPDIECRTDCETPLESATHVLNAILAWLGQRNQ